MIRVLDITAFAAEWAYVFVFWRMLGTFLPLRGKLPVRIVSFFAGSFIAVVVVYSNDLSNLLGVLAGTFVYVAVFHEGIWVKKLTAVLLFYPAVIAVNFLMQDTGSSLFFWLTKASSDSGEWTEGIWLWSTGIHTATLLLRLAFWIGAWRFLKKYLSQVQEYLTVKMWLMVDILMLAPFVSVFTIIYFMPNDMLIEYPICVAAIFSSFGCMYLASYICNATHTAYRVKALEAKQAYFSERVEEEQRVRSIYHDMKNHLLVLQSQKGQEQSVKQSLEELSEQIAGYENYYHTGNDYLDVIIRDKARQARKHQIDFVVNISFEKGGFLDALDVSTIFGNAMDNAIEASLRLPESMRLLTVKASPVHNMLAITVENNMQAEEAFSGKTTKEDKFLHGFGISNIQKAAEKYGGYCTAGPKDGKFILKVLLPVPEE